MPDVITKEVTYEQRATYKTSKEEMEQTLAITSWDTSNIVKDEVEYRKENWQDFYNDMDKCPDDEKIQEDVLEDSDLFSMRWDDVIEYLSELMAERNKSNNWIAKVKNFGWRSIDGHKEFTANNGQEFLQSILPNCDCTFYVHNYIEDDIKGFAIQNFHHDSPVGNEWYYILPN
jgi:hypothetical protein